MMHRCVFLSLCLLALLWAACAPATDEVRGPERPDVIVILADDMGFSDIGSYGGEIDTPALDRLAAQGLRFTQFYNAARCVPTRASLLTGLYNHRAGLGLMEQDMGLPTYRGNLRDQTVTLAEVLGAEDYGTYMAGKWHLTSEFGAWLGDTTAMEKRHWPLGRGFDRFYGTLFGAGSYFDPVTLVDGEMPVEPETERYYYTDVITDHAVQYVRDHVEAAPERPFFLYVAYTAPHWPLHALPEDVARYAGRYAGGWDSLRTERHRRLVEAGLVDERWALSPRDPEATAWAAVPADERRWYEAAMEVYAAQVDRMDRGIGRLVEALETTGRLDNTLILFLSDNGATDVLIRPGWGERNMVHVPTHTRDGREVRVGKQPGLMPGPADTYQSYGRPWANAGNTPFRLYKSDVHEGGIATPLIAHWPAGIAARGDLTHAVGHVIDLMPTILDAVGVAYPATFEERAVLPVDGRSLRPVFEGRDLPPDTLFWEHTGDRAVRAGDWKLVSRFDNQRNGPAPWELYDLAADRTELNDLAEADPERVARLAALYDAWAARTGVVPWVDVKDRPIQSAGIWRVTSAE